MQRAKGAKKVTPAIGISALVGTSAVMRKLVDTIDRIARYRTNVLILGESGTGKELIARTLHARGLRRNAPFVPVNCATLARELLENELFGHERGAFPGATERKRGLFEIADGGSLFLDEIGAMEASLQAKLLRVLERSEFRRVGGTRKLRVDLSIIATTNRDLPTEIAAGRFRHDLFYRLKVATVIVPPLRERREDIPALVDAFIDDFNRRNDGKIRGIAPAALRRLMEHAWPGNVRELRNVVESAAMLSDGDTLVGASFEQAIGSASLRPRDLVDGVRDVRDGRDEIRVRVGMKLEDVERALIAATIARARTRTEAAQMLGIGARTLYTKLKQYGIA